MTARAAGTVSRVLTRAGITTGLRYNAFGYRLRDGRPLDGPGCIVTRTGDARYGGRVDYGEVRVYPVRRDGHPDVELADRVLAALLAAGLPATANPSRSTITVEDPA